MAATSFRICAVLLLVAIVGLAAAASTGGDKRLEAAKKAASQKAKCEVCSEDYKPICGQDGAAGKPVTFGNACVLKKAACESGKQYTKQYDGECKNGGAVRLQ